MSRSVVVDGVVSIVLDPGVWGFVEAEMPEDTSGVFELDSQDFPEGVDGMFCGWIEPSKGGIEVVMIPSFIELALHDALEIAEIEEEPLVFPDVCGEHRSLNGDFKCIGVPVRT
jgi:hypothetical protein